MTRSSLAFSLSSRCMATTPLAPMTFEISKRPVIFSLSSTWAAARPVWSYPPPGLFGIIIRNRCPLASSPSPDESPLTPHAARTTAAASVIAPTRAARHRAIPLMGRFMVSS